MLIPDSAKEYYVYPGIIKGILCLSRTHQRNHMLIPDLSRGKLRRFPKGDRKALWSRPQARNPLLHRRNQMVMDNIHRQVFVRGESNPNLYFSTGRKVPKAHRGGQSVHEGVAAPDPPYPNGLSAHPWGAALISPRGGEGSSLGEALARHHIQHASSTGSLAWGRYPKVGISRLRRRPQPQSSRPKAARFG